MIHLAIQKRSGKIFKIMKVISRACLISSAGKRLKELRMQLRITVLRLSFTKESRLWQSRKLAEFRKLNLVTVDGKTAMAKQSFGRKTFERYLNQTGVAVDFPKLKPVNADTPLMLQLDGLIERAPHDMLIVSKSKQIVNVISERHPEIGIWTGDIQEGLYKKFVVATSQVLGVGVDGLQHKYQTIVVLDPVEEGSGEYDDYRQLLWRITGSRQQHDVNVIEFYYKES